MERIVDEISLVRQNPSHLWQQNARGSDDSFSIRRFYGAHFGVSPFKFQFRFISSGIDIFGVISYLRKSGSQYFIVIILELLNNGTLLRKAC